MESPQKKTARNSPNLPGTSNVSRHAEEDEWHALGSTQVVAPSANLDTDDELAKVVPKRRSPTTDLIPEAKSAMTEFGDFRLVKKVGQGAMATVYKARQISIDRKVALKILHKSVAANPKLVERFYREARVMGQLDHPNIVQGYGVGEVNGVHYFAMEYVSGETLQQWLNKVGRLSVRDALYITLACARALEYAHANGLVHRDVKPENILITRKGKIKLADLGMVKLQDEDMSLTQTGHAVGTPWYMPLEQARNAKEVDGRCDIYALGCTLYCMLTGKPPFMGANIVEVIEMKQKFRTCPSARPVNPDVPERLDLIIATMTEREAKDRYANCTELMAHLKALGLESRKLGFHKPSTHGEDISDLDLGPVSQEEMAGKSDIWYLRCEEPDGKVSAREYTTAEIISLVQSEEIPPSSSVSRTESGGFRSLATYKEFRHVTLALAAKNGADRQTARYRNLYKKIEEQDEKRLLEHQTQEEADRHISENVRTGLILAGSIMGGIFQLWVVISLVRSLLG